MHVAHSRRPTANAKPSPACDLRSISFAAPDILRRMTVLCGRVGRAYGCPRRKKFETRHKGAKKPAHQLQRGSCFVPVGEPFRSKQSPAFAAGGVLGHLGRGGGLGCSTKAPADDVRWPHECPPSRTMRIFSSAEYCLHVANHQCGRGAGTSWIYGAKSRFRSISLIACVPEIVARLAGGREQAKEPIRRRRRGIVRSAALRR